MVSTARSLYPGTHHEHGFVPLRAIAQRLGMSLSSEQLSLRRTASERVVERRPSREKEDVGPSEGLVKFAGFARAVAALGVSFSNSPGSSSRLRPRHKRKVNKP